MPRKICVEVKETGSGHPYLIVEPYEDTGLPDDKRISVKFPEGTTIEHANDLARTLNKTTYSIEVVPWG
ncbi:hypothetical protein SAMN04515695_0330 [Pseudovibrio sp. Tun.PSC04-5.I4]|nr:hypothetical protein SAMN04515695_0330 [Pseudovibrio sp. Tun.PSC04-5.I4]